MGQSIVVREMVPSDLSVVCLIDQAVDIAPWSEKLFIDCLRLGYECYVLLIDSVIVGFGILSYGAKEAHLIKLAINPQQQGIGLGHKMLQHLIAMAKLHYAEKIFLEVRVSNIVAISLYKKFAFTEIGLRKGYYPGDELKGHQAEDAITMALSLWL